MLENNFHLRKNIEHVTENVTPFRKKQEIENDLGGDERLGWMFYDSPLEEYDIQFRKTLPENISSLAEYVKEIYKEKKGRLIGIELGGPGKKLFTGLAPEYFSKTAGFTLHNKLEGKKKDTSDEQHQVIEADVFSRRKDGDVLDGYQKIEKWIKENGKADIIIEKMVAPIDALSAEYLLLVIKRWYKLLNQGGTLFLELPLYSYGSKIETFLKKYEDIFDFQIIKKEKDSITRNGLEIAGTYIRIRRLQGAPDSIDELLKDENLE